MAFNYPNNPSPGQQYNPAPGLIFQWNGHAWVGLNAGGVVEEAPVDSLPYGRQDGLWVRVTEEAPMDTRAYVRKDGDWEISDTVMLDAPADGTPYARRDAAWDHIEIVDIPNLDTVLDTKIEDAPPGTAAYGRQAGDWAEVVAEAPTDGLSYVRENAAWTELQFPPFPEAPSDSSFYGRKNAAWVIPAVADISGLSAQLGTYLLRTGGVMTGNLTISFGGAGLTLNKTAITQSAVMAFTSVNSTRWAVGVNPDTGASNGGADFFFDRYSDAGAPLGRLLTMKRSTGVVDFAIAPTVAGAALLPDAPSNGNTYVRFNATWAIINWATLTGKPTTFPPAGHLHPTSDVTGLDAALTARPVDAPNDGSLYARANAAWRHPVTTDITDLPGILNNLVEEAPSDGQIYGRRDNLWTPAVAMDVFTELLDRIAMLETRIAVMEGR